MRSHSTSKPKALNVFIIAEQFRYAGKLATIIPSYVREHPSGAPGLLGLSDLYMPTASMVCAAFSLELYFKCLLRIGRKPSTQIHDLEKLYRLIGRRFQAKIKRYWRLNSETVLADVEAYYADSGRPTPRVTFDFVLSVSKDAFRKFRYVHEIGIESDSGWLGDTIVESARRAILDIHPEWEDVRQASPMPRVSLSRSTFQVH